MGARTVRITREELLIAPEFRDQLTEGQEAARVGGARVELLRDGALTRMGACYQQIPLRVMPPFQLEGEPACLLYLINLTAGLLDGDGHLVELTVREGARAVVTGQSATRVHPARKGYCTQQWIVNVEQDACLVVLPGPTIPYQGCRYHQCARVDLAPGARLIWGDIWTAGRYERGASSERFQFERIVQDMEVRQAGKLVFRDRFRWDGPWTSQQADWYFGGALAAGTLLINQDVPEPLPELPELPAATVLRLDHGVTCLRWCGHPTAVATALVQTAMRLASNWTSPLTGNAWLLNSTELSPNHWFSPAPRS